MKKIIALLMAVALIATSYAVTFQWDAVTDPTVVSYRVYFATNTAGPFTKSFSTTNLATSIVVDNKNFVSLKTNYAIVVAVSNEGIESDPSNEVNFVVTNKPGKVQNFRLVTVLP
jgi:fibronectin type 3 domain-containing protein